MPCFKNPVGAPYNFNDAIEDNPDEKNSGRREGVYTGTKIANLISLDSVQKYDKTEEDYKIIKKAIFENNLIKSVLESHRSHVAEMIINAMQFKEIGDQENLFFERDEGNQMFITRSGTYNVIRNGKKIGIFSDQRVIGELAVFYKSKRPYTVRTVGAGSMWVIDRFTFQSILVHNSIEREKEMFSFLKKVPEINKLTNDDLQKVMALFEKESIPPDTVVVDEQTEIKKLYILDDGWAVATKDKIGKVRDFYRGDFFGEKCLLQKQIADVTIAAKDNGAQFLTLHKGVYQKYVTNTTTAAKSRKISTVSLNNLPMEEHVSNLKLSDFEKVETIGKGGFGKVDIVYNKNNKNQVFALKYINKACVVEFLQVENIFNEKNVQMNLKNNFIVRMYRTYKDKKYLYFLLEPCMGGDLYSLLQKQKNTQFPEASVKFYSACVIEAFDYLHRRNCIYRDLKPENLIIDSKGYVKLTDFGFSKMLIMSKTYTFAGTPEYLAPEIILHQGHDKAVDYWALGIFIFELLTGKTPFETNDPSHLKTYEAILKGIKTVDVPKHLTVEAVDIIKRFCQRKPVERLNFAEDVRNHKFFEGFSWSSFKGEKIKPPFIPQMTHPLDVRNFQVYNDNYVPPDEVGDWAENF